MYNLLEDRCINDVTVNLLTVLYIKTSSVIQETLTLSLLCHICDLLLSRHTATRSLFGKRYFLEHKQKWEDHYSIVLYYHVHVRRQFTINFLAYCGRSPTEIDVS